MQPVPKECTDVKIPGKKEEAGGQGSEEKVLPGIEARMLRSERGSNRGGAGLKNERLEPPHLLLQFLAFLGVFEMRPAGTGRGWVL